MASVPGIRIVRILVVALAAFVTLTSAGWTAINFPPLTGRVVDDAGILSAPTRQKLDSLLAEHEKQTGNQVVVATLKSLQGQAIEQFGYQLGRAWGIGQKGKNNGAILIVAPNERKVRIEVGYGLEGTLTDAQSKLIIENILLPAFRKNKYDAGVLAGTVTILRVLGGNPSNADSYLQPRESAQTGDDSGGIPGVFILLILLIVFGRFFWPFLFLGGGHYGGAGHGWGRRGGGFSGGGGSFGGGGASGGW